MTIDTNELRRLAQAATPGPWYVTGKLTRYVEALIDGGLIQEVAACGPTKADGGYGPQQEANARLIATANPAAISELLDRLEAAEKERDALRAKMDQMERQGPIGTTGGMPGTTGFTMACFHADKVPIGSKLYALPGAKGEEK